MYKNIESKKRRNYAATATAMDSMIGDVVELYKQFGYWDNTIVVFSSGIFQNASRFIPDQNMIRAPEDVLGRGPFQDDSFCPRTPESDE